MRIIIAEKPSVAQAIAKVLGVTARKEGYLECGDDLVSWCVGHVVELADATAYWRCRRSHRRPRTTTGTVGDRE